jgi:uncharacterized membrane protein
MGVLTSFNLWLVMLLMIVVITTFTVLVNLAIARFLGAERHQKAGHTAEYYMTALGSLFAFLTGFLISAEYSTLRDARNAVGAEVAAASQLAQASGSLTPADTGEVQEKLTAYLTALTAGEWAALAAGAASASPAGDRLRALQTTVFRVTSKPYVPGAAASTLQDSVNAITTSRRRRRRSRRLESLGVTAPDVRQPIRRKSRWAWRGPPRHPWRVAPAFPSGTRSWRARYAP